MPQRAETEFQWLRASLASLVPEGSLELAAFLSGAYRRFAEPGTRP